MKPTNSPLRAGLLAVGMMMSLPLAAADAPALSGATVRLFEQSDDVVLPFGRRLYGDLFDATLARAIGIEIGATYAAPDQAILLAVDCVLTNPDGSTAKAARDMSFQLFAGETQSNSANVQWAAPDEEDWQPGNYAIDCAIAGRSVWQTQFTMSLNPPVVTDTDVRIAGLRFFPVDGELPPKTERRYTETFEAADTRRIGVELEYTHSALGRTVTVPASCHYYWPDGQVMPPAVMRYEPGPTWPGGYSAANMGWEVAGKWPVGYYVVACLVGGKPAVINRFEVR